MDLTALLTDDQLAVLGCMAALGVCGLIATITYYTGAAGRQSRTESRSTVPLQSVAPAEHSQSQKAA